MLVSYKVFNKIDAKPTPEEQVIIDKEQLAKEEAAKKQPS